MSETKQNTIGKDFTFLGLLKFSIGPVLARLLVSVLQTLDDSLFISRYCGENALAAFSITLPMIMIFDAFGMLTGAVSSHCSIKMGQGKQKEAMADFTTMCLLTMGFGLIFTIILALFLDPILILLGETEILMPYARDYFSIAMFNIPFIQLNYVQSRFYVISGKPKYSVISNILNTCSNLLFDYLFIVRFNMGIKGAAITNVISNVLIGLLALFFFSNKNREIHYVKPNSNIHKLLKDVFKLGKSSFITSISISINTFISNAIQLKMGGEVFVSAFSIVNGVQFIFMNVFFSLLGTTNPLISYAYGAKDAKKLSRVLKQIFGLVTLTIGFIIIVFVSGKDLILNLYLGKSSSIELKNLVYYGLTVAPLAFLVFGYNVFVQEAAMSMSNTKVSTTLSIIQNVIFANLFMIVLPMIFGKTIIWYVFFIGEACTFAFSLYCIIKYKGTLSY